MASQAGPPLGTRQAEALIDLGAIAANLRGHLSRTCAPVMAVVSADACGHGAAQVARTALDHGASWLGVSFAAEAPALRGNGNSAPILALLPTPDEELVSVLSADVDVSISSTAQLQASADCAARLGRRAEVHLKADTGLHHDGATAEEWPALVAAAAALERRGDLHVRGIWSQLVHPDEPENDTSAAQARLFDAAVRRAEAAGLTRRLRHLAGSAAARRVPQLHYDMVRIGSGLYGVGAAAHAETEADKGLIPAMSLRSRIVATQRVPAGEGVSFGHRYTTTRETTLGLVPLGFADGLPRSVSGRACLWVDGRRCPIAGRIAMNSTVLDLGTPPEEPFGKVVVFGPGAEGEPTAADWAAWARTDELEILTRVSPRLPRSHVPASGTPRPGIPAEPLEIRVQTAVGPG